jgi:iron complex outermembrane recepter protein
MTIQPTHNIRARLTLGVALSALIATGFVSTASAQATTPDPRAEVVVVTGSRLNTANNRSISPVQVIGADEIRASGNIDLDEILKQQNQFLPSNGATTNPSLLESHGASTIDMRGLGQNRTLVLINGLRATPNGFRNSVDTNVIPSTLIKRVEYLTGGAAAVYGADAVSGVTNFILNDKYEGLEISTSGNQAQSGDAQNFTIGATGGVNFFNDRANITAHVSYSERGLLERTDREWALPEVNDAGAFLALFPTAGGSFTRLTGTTAATTPLFAYNRGGALGTTSDTEAFSRFEAFINPQERWNASVFGRFEVSKQLEFYVRGFYSVIDNTSQQVPVRSNSKAAAQDVLIRRDNPFITPQIAAALAGQFNLNFAGTGAGTDAVRLRVAKTLTELGPLTDTTERTYSQLVFGAKGSLTDSLRYEVSYVTGENVEEVNRTGWGTIARFQQAVTATTVNGQAACVDPSNGCVPFNLFGPNAASKAAVDFITGDTSEVFNERNREQDVFAATLTGDTIGVFELPGGPIGWVLGYEKREEYGNSKFGPNAATGLNLHTQGARGLILEARYDISETYAELRLPLVKDLPFIASFDLEGAIRFSEHSQAGDYDTSKIGFNWRLNENFRVRAAQQTVVRGANIGELFTSAANANPITGNVTDPCADPATSGADAALCRATGAPAPGYSAVLVGATALQGGDPTIRPETGETITYGFVFTPQFIPGLSVVVDYYKITLDDAIGTISPQQTMELCYVIRKDASSIFCQNIARNPTSGLISQIKQGDTNITLLETSGYDFSIYYNARLPAQLPGERINIAYTGGIVDTFIRQATPFNLIFDCAGGWGGGTCSDAGTGIRAIPEFRSNLAISWINGPLSLRTSWRYQGDVQFLQTNIAPALPNTNRVQKIKAYDYFDLGVSYRFNDNLRGSFTISNIFDTEPPILGSNQQDANTLPNQYDIIGRRFGFNLVWKM